MTSAIATLAITVERTITNVERTITNAHVLVEGPLDLQTGPALLDRLALQDFDDCEQVVLDLASVPFMDSSGLVALLAVYHLYGERLRIIPNDRLESVITHAAARSFLPIESLPTGHDPGPEQPTRAAEGTSEHRFFPRTAG